MGDTLKIFFSTIILVLVTSIVFFALYFLFPDVSEQAFGISYRSSKEEPLETLDMILVETAPVVEDNPSPALQDQPAVSTQVEEIPDSSTMSGALPQVDVQDGMEPADPAPEPVQVSESGRQVLSFLETPKGKTLSGSVGALGGLDIQSLVDTDGGRELVNAVGSYLEKTGQSMDDIFSNRAIMSALTGKVDEKVAGLLSYLKEEGVI